MPGKSLNSTRIPGLDSFSDRFVSHLLCLGVHLSAYSLSWQSLQKVDGSLSLCNTMGLWCGRT